MFLLCVSVGEMVCLSSETSASKTVREREKSSYEEVKTTLSKTAIILLDFAYAHTRTHTSSFRSVSHYTSFRRQDEDVLTTTLSLETLKNIIGCEKEIQKYTHNGFIM